MHNKMRGCDFAGTQSKPKRLFCHVLMAGNVYAGFHGLAANADQIATGWGLALIRSTVSGLALSSANPTSVVGQEQPLEKGSFWEARWASLLSGEKGVANRTHPSNQKFSSRVL